MLVPVERIDDVGQHAHREVMGDKLGVRCMHLVPVERIDDVRRHGSGSLRRDGGPTQRFELRREHRAKRIARRAPLTACIRPGASGR